MYGVPIGGETVIRLRATIVTSSGSHTKEEDWTNPATVTYTGCHVQPPLLGNRLLVEDDKERRYVSFLYKLFVPGNVDIMYTDRLQWRGQTFEVRSNPGKEVDLDGFYDFTQIMMELKSG